MKKILRACGIVLLWMTLLAAASGVALAVVALGGAPAVASPASHVGGADGAKDVAPAGANAGTAAQSADAEDHGRDQDHDSSSGSHDRTRDDRRDAGEDDHSGWEGSSQDASRRHHRDLVNIGSDSVLPAGERADSVVSIIGSSTAAGDAADVVSVFGSTKVTGSVRHGAVAILGDAVIDGPVGDDVVAVLGSVRLGPNANVGGDVVAVGGGIERDPAAQVHGTMQTVAASLAGFAWLKPWINNCLFYGRPLALAAGLSWAWVLALCLLALYVGLALLFRDGVTRCVQTLESQPGMTLVAALLTMLLTPVLLVLLCITFVGIAAVPFVAAGLFCASLFGKTVMLAWLGQRAVGARRAGALGHPAVAVLVGGAIALVLYLVPVLGFIVYKILGLFGLGAVVYTLVLLVRARRAGRSDRPDGVAAASPAAAPSAGVAGSAGVAPDSGRSPGPEIASGPGVPGAPDAPAPPISAAGLPRAGFWIRMAALLLDALLVGFLMGMLHHEFRLELLALAIYGAMMWKLRGSTVGGVVFDLQVVRLDDRPIDWETAIIRALGCFLSLAVIGLGFFWIAFDAGRQAWHDKIAGTAVVRVRKGVPLV